MTKFLRIALALLIGSAQAWATPTATQPPTAWLGFDTSVSVMSYGADPTGTTDSTSAFQNALNSGYGKVRIPCGTFVISSVVMPTTSGFVLAGDGTCSVLKQASSGSAMIRWPTTSTAYVEGYVRNLAFDGTNGASDMINTSGVGGETFEGLYFGKLPTGYSGIYVNGAASTYTHDIRLHDIQIYSNQAGFAGIRFGALSSDSEVSQFTMNGGFAVQYGIYMDANAQTIKVSQSHPYNAAINIVYTAGNNNNLMFSDTIFDNAGHDLVRTSGSNSTFTHNLFEAIPSGYSGLALVSAQSISLDNNQFAGSSGAAAAVTETGSSNYTTVTGGNLGTLANFTAPFAFLGAQSFATNVPGYTGPTLIAGGIKVYGAVVSTMATPASSSAACTQGQIEFDAAYVYSCVATNTWRRTATSSF